MVSVGADIVHQRATRWLLNTAARLAFFRSFRDAYSRDAMRRSGVDVTLDPVYPDLVFGLPTPSHEPGDPQTVAVGVMAYHGSNDDRREADAIYASYVANVTRFVRWLVDNGRNVRLLIGDANGSDDGTVHEIMAGLRVQRPDLEPARVVAEPVSSLADVLRELARAGTVVAPRYHNVVCALRLCKPTIALGYSAKHESLMTDMGVPEFCQPAHPLDVDLLIERFTELESQSAESARSLKERTWPASRAWTSNSPPCRPCSSRLATLADHACSTRAAYMRSFAASNAHMSAVQDLIPGGAHTYAKGDDQYPAGMAPVIERGAGSRVWDLDGNEYVEFGSGLRSTVARPWIPAGDGRGAAAGCPSASISPGRTGSSVKRPSGSST